MLPLFIVVCVELQVQYTILGFYAQVETPMFSYSCLRRGDRWFKYFDKYCRVFVWHTRKIPVELVNIFLRPTDTPPLPFQRQITYKERSHGVKIILKAVSI